MTGVQTCALPIYLTQTGAVMGTPMYMAPEQARGQSQLIGPPTDVWAIGLIAYRLGGQTTDLFPAP